MVSWISFRRRFRSRSSLNPSEPRMRPRFRLFPGSLLGIRTQTGSICAQTRRRCPFSCSRLSTRHTRMLDLRLTSNPRILSLFARPLCMKNWRPARRLIRPSNPSPLSPANRSGPLCLCASIHLKTTASCTVGYAIRPQERVLDL